MFVITRGAKFVATVVEQLRVEPYDLRVAEAHAELLAHTRRAGRVRGGIDLVIAATAVATNRLVVTLDRTGFADLPGVVVRLTGLRSLHHRRLCSAPTLTDETRELGTKWPLYSLPLVLPRIYLRPVCWL